MSYFGEFRAKTDIKNRPYRRQKATFILFKAIICTVLKSVPYLPRGKGTALTLITLIKSYKMTTNVKVFISVVSTLLAAEATALVITGQPIFWAALLITSAILFRIGADLDSEEQ